MLRSLVYECPKCKKVQSGHYDVPEATAITLGFEVKVNCEHCREHFPLKVNFMQIPNEVAARIHLANN